MAAIENPVETVIGAAVLAVAIGFGVYASQFSNAFSSGGDRYPVEASFRAAVGVSPGTDVMIAGVKVGNVTDLRLNQDTARAQVTMAIDNGVELTTDTFAKIDSEGLLGGAYIALEPGSEEVLIEPGGRILNTQGSISLFDLVSKFTGGSSSE